MLFSTFPVLLVDVAKMMGKNEKTIRKYLNEPVPETNRRGPRRKAIDRYFHDIEKGLRAGPGTGEILEILKARGYSAFERYNVGLNPAVPGKNKMPTREFPLKCLCQES